MPATIAIRPRTSPWSGPAIARAPEHVLLEAAAILNRSDAARVLHEEKGMPLDFATRLGLIWDAYLAGSSSQQAVHESCSCAGACTPCKEALTESLTTYEQAVADVIVGASEAYGAQSDLWRHVRERMWGHPDGLPGLEAVAEALADVGHYYRLLVDARRRGRLIRLMQDLDAELGGELTYKLPGGLGGASLEDMARALHALQVPVARLTETTVDEAGVVKMVAELAAVEGVDPTSAATGKPHLSPRSLHSFDIDGPGTARYTQGGRTYTAVKDVGGKWRLTGDYVYEGSAWGFPHFVEVNGVKYYPTFKTGTSRRTGAEMAEYDDGKGGRVWATRAGEVHPEGITAAGLRRFAAKARSERIAAGTPRGRNLHPSAGLDERQFVLYSPAAQRPMGGGTLGQPDHYASFDEAAWVLLQTQLSNPRASRDLVVAEVVRSRGGVDYVPVKESAAGWGKPGELAEADADLRRREQEWKDNRGVFVAWLNLALAAARSGRRLHLVWGDSKPSWAFFQITQVDDNPPQMRIEYGRGIRGRTKLPKVVTPASWSQFVKAVGPALPELNITYDNTPPKAGSGGGAARAKPQKLKVFLLTQDPYNDRHPVSSTYKSGDRRALERAAFTITGWGGNRLGSGAEGRAWVIQATNANEARLIAQGADGLRALAFNFWTNIDNLSLPSSLDLPPAGASPKERQFEPPVGGRSGLPQTRGGRGTNLDYYALDLTRKLVLIGGAGAQPSEFPWSAVLRAANGTGLTVRYTWGAQTVSPDVLRDRIFPLARKVGWSVDESQRKLNESWGTPGSGASVLAEGPIYLRGEPTLIVTSDDGWSSWGITYNGRSSFQLWTKYGNRWGLTGAYMMKDLPRSGPWKPAFLQGMPRAIPAKEVARIQRGAVQKHGYAEPPKAEVIDLPRPKHPQGPARIVGKPVLNRNNNYDGKVEWYVVARDGTWGLTAFSSEDEARKAAARIFTIQRDGTEVFEGLSEADLPGLAGLSSAERAAAIRRALGMPDAAPASSTPARVDQRKYQKVGDLARGYALWQRPSKNSVYMVTRDGKPVGRSFKIRLGRKLLGRVTPGSGRGLEDAEFQLNTAAKMALLSADLGTVLIEGQLAEGAGPLDRINTVEVDVYLKEPRVYVIKAGVRRWKPKVRHEDDVKKWLRGMGFKGGQIHWRFLKKSTSPYSRTGWDVDWTETEPWIRESISAAKPLPHVEDAEGQVAEASSDSSIRDLERRAQTGDQAAKAQYKRALNRAGRTPPNETFLGDQVKDAAKLIRGAAALLERGAQQFGGQPENPNAPLAASPVEAAKNMKAFAKAMRSASSRLTKWKMPRISAYRAYDPVPARVQIGPTQASGVSWSYPWDGYYRAADEALRWAARIMRSVANGVERETGTDVFVTAGWIDRFSQVLTYMRDRNAGYSYNSDWKKAIPTSAVNESAIRDAWRGTGLRAALVRKYAPEHAMDWGKPGQAKP